ncbi:MAG: hypothetical protein HYY06_15040 [Deltaproteobacteria bacterium]|nr:hypothetical protein [Deltaproteobacteria bacterium]
MGRRLPIAVVKKSVTLNQDELDRVKVILDAKTDSEAIRTLIRERLAVEGALRAHRRIGRGKGIDLVEWR